MFAIRPLVFALSVLVIAGCGGGDASDVQVTRTPSSAPVPAPGTSQEVSSAERFGMTALPSPGAAGAELPPGHPPIPGMDEADLPPGHPPIPGMNESELPPGHPPIPGMDEADLPPGHPPIPPMAGIDLMAIPEDTGLSDNLRWTAPDGWRRAPDRPVRLVTYTLPGDAVTECVVTILSSAGGGKEANINRWREQMGQSPLADEEIDALPQIEVLGAPAPLVEIPGSFTGMDRVTHENAIMLGVIATVPGQTVFVRMTGPAETIEQQRENFVAFCESLHIDDTPSPAV